MLSLVFSGNNLNWKLVLLLIFHYQSHIWQNSGSWVIGQNAVTQSNFRIASNVISQGRSGEVHFWNADKHQSFLQIDTITFGVHSKAYRKYPKNKLVISFQYLKENVKDEGSQKRSKDGLYFFHADKHQCFYNLELLFLIEVASVQSTQNRILVTFPQDLKKKVMQLLLCYTVM